MRKLFKRTVATALAGAMALSLAACGGTESTGTASGENATTTESAEGEEITLRITWWGGQSRHEYTQQMLDKYTELHPNIHFEATPSGWDGYFEKLATDTATGSMPDIVQMDYLYVSTYAANNSLADLTPYMEDGTINTSTIDTTLLNSGNVNGKQIAMPLSTSLIAVGFSPACLAAAGLEEPTSAWTWDDFADMCVAVQEKTGNLGSVVAPVDDTNLFNYWVRQRGGQLFADDNKSLGFDDPAILSEYFTYWKELMDKGGTCDPDEYEQLSTLGIEGSPMATDECGFQPNWNNYTTLMTNANPNLKMATPPVLEGGQNGLWMKPGMFFSVAETSEHKKECAEFIEWFLNSEEANAIMMGERGTPASSTAREYLIDSGKLSVQQQQMFDYVDAAASMCGDTPAPDPVGISEVNQAFKDIGYSVFYGQVSPEDAAVSFMEQANSILATNN